MSNAQAPLVQARGLRKVYQRRGGAPVVAVDGIDLDILPGEVFSLLGPNGAGKTTTIHMISGLVAPTAGDATIGGHSITRAPMAAKRHIGVVPQDIALYSRLTARQNLTFFGQMLDLRGATLSARVDEVLDFIDLRDRQHDPVETFSGGMKRRVNIGVGLLHRPALVYMDEPTVGIDPQNRRNILDTVLRLRDERGMAVLYTTHLMEESQQLSDRVAIIDHGRIIAQGTVADLTREVGEADRLVFDVGAQPLDAHVLARLRAHDGVQQVEQPVPSAAANGAPRPATLDVAVVGGRRALPTLLQLLNEMGVVVQSVSVREPDLEAVFLHLTGRALRD